MNYDLAKQLKDAGFPQEGRGRRIGPPANLTWKTSDLAYQPTLEELIAACGNHFLSLDYLSAIKGHVQWGAKGTQFTGLGVTPTEAVARLWLSLQLPA
jgi:hypothetical protein